MEQSSLVSRTQAHQTASVRNFAVDQPVCTPGFAHATISGGAERQID
jgi:hypothetical protein